MAPPTLFPPPTEGGLRRNARLFALLVLVNAFVGIMVGVERTLVPLVGEQEFGVASKAAVLSFIATFGLVKAFANLFAGSWAEHLGRRRILIAGWLIGLPVPLLLMFAPPPHWWIIVAANVLLGVNQGLCWSITVIMKVDIAGERRRGLAMGLNEFAGYGAVALASFATGYLASVSGLRPVPFLLGLVAAVLGLATSFLLVPETIHVVRPAWRPDRNVPGPAERVRGMWSYTATHRGMLVLNQAGFVNNLNDGVAWGLFPFVFAASVTDTSRIGFLVALYPLVWGLGQLVTGPLSDHVGRRGLIAGGLVLQGAAIAGVALGADPTAWAASMALLGAGTAMVYPTLLAAVGDVVPPAERATALGVYRFWRDLGFFGGAVGAGLIADVAGMEAAILATAGLTAVSGVAVALHRTEG